MSPWLKAALDYVPRWIEFQMRLSEQLGYAIAVVHRGRVVLDRAFGHADVVAGVPLNSRHRFRVASHSKSFTAAGIMKLREQDRLRLNDRVGQYVDGLHPAVAEATISQLLSHGAGLVRDWSDSGQWLDRRPFADADKDPRRSRGRPDHRAEHALQVFQPWLCARRLRHEAITGEAYAAWNGRWSSLPRTIDLVAVGDRVLAAMPALPNPFLDASEIVLSGRDRGRIVLATGFANHGEPVRRVRGRDGKASELWLAGTKMLGETTLAREIEARYGGRKRARASGHRRNSRPADPTPQALTFALS